MRDLGTAQATSSMTRVADRVDVSLIAGIRWTGGRVLSIDLPWKEDGASDGSFR